MAAKRKIDVVMTDDADADLDAIVALAASAGVDLTYALTSGGAQGAVDGARVLSKSLVARLAFALASGRVRPLGAQRLRRARERSGLATSQIAEAAGCTAGHVRAVECGAVPLSPRGLLAAWVEAQEKSL